MNKSTHTLIIHPEDETTDFLRICYAEAKNTTVITGIVTSDYINDQLDRPDQRIVLMGHGSPQGLFNIYGFVLFGDSHAVGDPHAEYLRHNPDNIMIFCYADTFARRNNLPGFRCDMFISEVREAVSHGLTGITQEEIDFSNELFCRLVGEKFYCASSEIYRHVKAGYGEAVGKSEVVRFNHQRLFYEGLADPRPPKFGAAASRTRIPVRGSGQLRVPGKRKTRIHV